MKSLLYLIPAMLLPLTHLQAEPQPAPATTKATGRVAFAQYCFWTGEMELGQIDGVVRTEAGFFQGREVTLVDFDPTRISLDRLAGEARKAGVADRIHLSASSPHSGNVIAGVALGALLDPSYRTAPASDQKKQLEGTPYSGLKLSPEQATKVNAFSRVNPAKAMEWLAPAQRTVLAGSR